MITLNCTTCGAEVVRKPYHAAMTKRPFCGFKCYAAWQKVHRKGVGSRRVRVACHTCGKAMDLMPYAVAPHNFCSRPCFAAWRSSDDWSGPNNPAWRGGSDSYRGPNWSRQAGAAVKRDGGACVSCGHAAGLQVHHKRPFRLFADYREANRLENLVTLCRRCHTREEVKFWRDHPELATISPFPIVVPVVACRKCGNDFLPKSGAALVCDACCTATCAHCRTTFYNRKATFRPVKYCSRACRNAAVRSHSRPLRNSSPTT